MRGFVQSLALAVAVFLAMKFPPFEYAIGFFGAIPLAGVVLLFKNLSHSTVMAVIIFAPSSISLSIHIAGFAGRREWEKLFSDSPFTLFTAAWIPFTLGVFQFL